MYSFFAAILYHIVRIRFRLQKMSRKFILYTRNECSFFRPECETTHHSRKND